MARSFNRDSGTERDEWLARLGCSIRPQESDFLFEEHSQ